MTERLNFIAADLGASSGRLMIGGWNGCDFTLEELHRFPNGGVRVADGLQWDVPRIWSEMRDGLKKYCARFGNAPVGIGVDAWGVDFALLDERGQVLGNPYHYRDQRTVGIPEMVFWHIDERELFSTTGVQSMQINTLFQLYSMVHNADPQLEAAATMLMIPDLFHYFLCGRKAVERTEATTTQMYATAGGWARDLLERLEIPLQILPDVVTPGTVLAPMEAAVLRSVGFSREIPVVATASHDTANAVAAIPNMDETSAFIISGTWSLMGVEVKRPVTSDRTFAWKFTNEGGAEGSTLLMRNLTGLWILQECMGRWAAKGHSYGWDDIMAMAFAAPALSLVLDVDANDFRAPDDMPAAIASYCRHTGQLVPQTDGAMARACLESLSLKYRSVLEPLEVLAERRLETIRVVGGGCLNPLLCQMTADACDRAVVSGPAEASAYGNVMLQAIATGQLRNVNDGRKAMAESIRCSAYFPRRTTAWDEAYLRLGQVQSTVCA